VEKPNDQKRGPVASHTQSLLNGNMNGTSYGEEDHDRERDDDNDGNDDNDQRIQTV
jgi:hypothetical protein